MLVSGVICYLFILTSSHPCPLAVNNLFVISIVLIGFNLMTFQTLDSNTRSSWQVVYSNTELHSPDPSSFFIPLPPFTYNVVPHSNNLVSLLL